MLKNAGFMIETQQYVTQNMRKIIVGMINMFLAARRRTPSFLSNIV